MHTGNFSQPDLISLNIMRMHKMIIHTSDIVLCDGKTIKAEMLTDQPGHSDVHKFPTQHPTPADLNLWKLALCKLSSDIHVFTAKLQECISPPHNHRRWMLNDIGTILHHNIVQGDKTYNKEYTPSSNPIDCRTRVGQRFNSTIVKNGPSDFNQYERVTPSQLGQVFYTTHYKALYLYHQSLDFNMWLNLLQTSPCGWWNVGTIPVNHPWWIIHEGGVNSHFFGGYHGILQNCQSTM